MFNPPFTHQYIDGSIEEYGYYNVVDGSKRIVARCSGEENAKTVADLMNKGAAISGLKVLSQEEWNTTIQKFNEFVNRKV